MKTPFLVDVFDLYGQDIPLQVFGKKKKKSIFGALIGVMSLLAMGSIAIYFLITLFSRDTKQIIMNDNYNLRPQNNLSQVPIFINFVDPLGNMIPHNAGIWDVKVFYVKAYWLNYTYSGIEFSPIEVRPCLQEDAGTLLIPSTTLAVSLCVPYGKYDLTINDIENDLNNGWTYLKYFLIKCNPALNPNCQNQTVIDKAFEKGAFAITQTSGVVNHDNNTNPENDVSKANILFVSNSLFKDKTIYLTQNLYTDDQGFVFESLTTFNFYSIGSEETIYSLDRPPSYKPLLGNVDPFAIVNYKNTPYVKTTKRTFLKGQTILANIGGVIEFIMIVARAISFVANRKSIFILVGNEVFDYNTKKIENNKSVSLRLMNNFVEIKDQNEQIVPIDSANSAKKDVNIPEGIINRRGTGTEKSAQRFNKVNERQAILKLTLWELLCIGVCIKNKKVVNQYSVTERTILEKLSVHSIIKDSYKLENLSKLTLDVHQHKNIIENVPLPEN